MRPPASGAWEAKIIRDLPIRLISVSTLLRDPALRSEAGVTDLHELAPPGTYERRPAVVVNPGDLYPAFRGPYLEDLSKLAQPHGSTFGFLLTHALVIGQGSVITRNGLLVQESCRAILAQNRTPPGLRPVGPGWVCPLPEPVRKEHRVSIVAKAPWWRNYGHWLVDLAALLALVVDRLRGNDIQIVIGKQVTPAMRRIVAETLEIVAPGIPVVEHDDAEAVMFSRLYYVTPTSVSPLFKLPEALRALRAKLVPDAPPPRRRIYVQRDAQGPRTLLNEPDVLRVASSHGFEIVRPEQHGLRDQARLFSEAAVVMGVKGAGLTNVMFAPRDSSVVVLSPSNWGDSFFWDLAGQLGITYVEVVGKAVDGIAEPPNSPFTVDLDRLGEALERATGTLLAEPVAVIDPLSSRPEHTGLFYRDCLRALHQILRPRAYLEIGCLDGETLALAECPAIGIDVQFQPKICIPPKAPAILLYQLPSDEFFRRYDPAALLGRPIDLAFIDGMHLVEYALRDFINVERFCHPGSVVVLHDCLPLNQQMASRDRADAEKRGAAPFSGWWTGDVWKLLAILPRYRPDLSVRACNASPTGLVVIQSLNPDDRTLDRAYEAIVAEFRDPAEQGRLFQEVLGKVEIMETSALLQTLGKRV